MFQDIEAVFEGIALQPEILLNLTAGTRVRIIVKSVLPNEVKTPKTFLKMAQSLKLEGEPDWSEKVDQYLYSETALKNLCKPMQHQILITVSVYCFLPASL